MLAEPEGNQPEDSKRTIDQPPPEWDAAQFAHEQGVGNEQHTSCHTDGKQPGVADRFLQRGEKEKRDDKVTKRQPVGSVGDEWVMGIGRIQCIADAQEPLSEGSGPRLIRAEEAYHAIKFALQRNCGCASDK